ncbi:putative peptidoglycan binding domain-containing protein, partial [Micromonospora sp. NPDC003776]
RPRSTSPGRRSGISSSRRSTRRPAPPSPATAYAGTGDELVDLRVDDHPDPVTELGRLLEVHTMLFGKPDPATLRDLSGPLAEEVAALLAAAGHPVDAAGLDDALASWAGVENLEERIVPGRIDPLVLDHLRRTTG